MRHRAGELASVAAKARPRDPEGGGGYLVRVHGVSVYGGDGATTRGRTVVVVVRAVFVIKRTIHGAPAVVERQTEERARLYQYGRKLKPTGTGFSRSRFSRQSSDARSLKCTLAVVFAIFYFYISLSLSTKRNDTPLFDKTMKNKRINKSVGRNETINANRQL